MVEASIGGKLAEVLFAGAAPDLDGVDQINIRLSRELIGRGELSVVLHADDQNANPVTISVK